jgi:hypothetical protein
VFDPPRFLLLILFSTRRRVQHTARRRQHTLQRAHRCVTSIQVRSKQDAFITPSISRQVDFILSVFANKSSLQPNITSLQSDKPSGKPWVVAALFVHFRRSSSFLFSRRVG